ncbi:MAG TPA: NPCBM/NEW2 domain-containing protein [Planctomycetaceae bacterium]|nr:NPCBM/NEW2 domain-containing protein [Planctomycetaceae bacterium]
MKLPSLSSAFGCPRLLVALAAAVAPGPAAARQPAADVFHATLADGRIVAGVPVELGDARIVLRGDQRIDVAAADVITLAAVGRREGPPAAGAAFVLLVNGDRLLLDRDSLRLSDVELTGRWHGYPAWQPLAVPLETVRGVVLDLPEARSAADRLLADLRDHAGRTDVVVLANGDRLAAEFRGLDANAVQLAGAIAAVPRSNVRALMFNPELFSMPASAGLRMLVGLVDGSRITGGKVQLDPQGQLQLEPAFGGRLDVPLARVATIRMLGGRADWLGRLEPDDYRFQPYLSASWPLHKDRNVTGGPLRLDGVEYPFGLGMHSRAAATYDLGGKYRWFHATIGVDDTAGDRGSIVFSVELDGQPVFTSPVLKAADAALRLDPVDLAGRQRLTLLVDYGPWGDVQDYANWCDAAIVK